MFKKTNLKSKNIFFKIGASLILIIITSSAFLLFGSQPVLGVAKTWSGGGTDGTCGGVGGDGNKWSCAANWTPSGAPATGDAVTFDGTSVKNATIDASAAASITSITINSGYSGIITLGRTFTISSFTQSAGTFTASNQAPTFTSLVLNTGGTFTASSGTTIVNSTFTINGGTFNHNSGTMRFSGGTSTITCNNATFNLVSFTGQSSTKTISSNCTLPLGSAPTIPDNLTLNGTLSGSGTATFSNFLTMNSGSALSGFTGISLTHLTVSGATVDFSGYASFTIAGVFNESSGSVSLPSTVSGSFITFTLSGGTFNSSSGNINIANGLTISGSPIFNANGGTVTFTTSGANNSPMVIACNNVTFNRVVITRSTGPGTFTVGSDCSLPLGSNPTAQTGGGNFTINGSLSGTGTLTHNTSSQIVFNTGSTISGFSGFNGSGITVAGANIDLSAYTTFTLDDDGVLSISSGSLALPAATGTFSVQGFSQTGGTFNASPSNLTVHGGNFSISGTTTYNANGGSITLTTQVTNTATSIACNNSSLNSVIISKSGSSTFTVNSDCNLPLGNNPTLTLGTGGLILNGTLTGTGNASFNNLLIINSGGTLSGFTNLGLASLTIAGATANLSTFGVTATGTVTLSSGTLTLPSTTDINGGLAISGGTFNASSGTMTVGGTLNITGSPTFNANNGTIDFDGSTASLTCNNVTFSTVSFAGQSGVKTVNSGCTLPLGSNPTIPNGITLAGTLSGTGTLTFATGTLTLSSGATFSTFTGIAASTVTQNGSTSNFSGLSTFTAAGLTTVTSGTITFPSGASLNAGLTVNGGTVASTTGNYSITGTFTLSSGSFTAPTGILNVNGAITFSGSPTVNANGGTFNFTGSGVILSCNSFPFNNVTFNNTGTITVNSNCSLPLGAGPTIANGITLNGTLTGSGILSMTAGTFTLNSGYALTTFSGLAINTLIVTGTTANFSSYLTFTASGSVTVNASSTLSLPGGSNITGGLTITGASSVLSATTGDITVGGAVSVAIGILNAPSGNFTIGGNFTHTSGTFTHNSGTVIFNGSSSQTIAGIASTFNNFTKILPSAASQTLTFPSGVSNTQTFLGTLTLNGFDTSNRLLLRSSSSPTLWRIDAQSTRNLLYLDVRDSNNINAASMQMGGTGSQDSTNNTGWNFSSLTPNDPSSLGPSQAISAIVNPDNTPNLQFTLSDPNPLDTIKYQIQVSTHSDFSSPVVDYSSALGSQGAKTFTVGQAAGTGTYTAGSQNQTLASGDYYWRVRATDNSSLVSSYTAANGGSMAFIIDADPPAAFTPGINVSSPTTNTTPQITFVTTDNVAVDHYQVKIDSGSFITRTSPYTLPTQANGAHTVTVRAFDTSDNTTDGVVMFTVDTSLPNVFTPLLNVTSPTNNTTPQVSFSTTDNDGINHYEVQVDAGSFTTQTSPYTLPALSQAAHTITVRAFDNAGNTRDETVNVTVDTTAPNTFTPTFNPTSPTTNPTPQVLFSTTDTNGINHYEVKVDAGSFTTHTSPYTLPTLAVGTHTITVRAFDNATNTRDGSADIEITESTGPAAFTPGLNVTSPTNNQTPQVTFSTTSPAGINHYEVKIDAGSFVTQTSPYTLPTLAEGAHTIVVRAIDNDTLTYDGSVNVTVDITQPNTFTPTISGGSPTNDTTPNINFGTTDNIGIDHYEVKIDAGSFTTHSSPYTTPALSQGDHSVIVRAFDGAGNTRDGTTLNFTVDTTQPATFTPLLNVSSPTSDTRPIVTFSTTDNVAISHYQVKVDLGSFTTQTSPYQVPTLADGSHTITIRAFDTAGNTRDGSVSFTVDVNAPDPFTPVLIPASPTNDTTPQVSFSTTDDGGIDHYEVKVDAGSFSTQVSPYQLSTLTEGVHTVIVRAFDTIGNTTDGSITFRIDTLGPAINYSAPTKVKNSDITNTTINITDIAGVNVGDVDITGGVETCEQTSATHVSCTLVVSASGDVDIDATDITGNNSSESITGYVIETTPPVIVITAPTKTSAITISDTTIQVTDNYGIAPSGVTAVSGGTISCSQTSFTIVDCTSTVSESGDLVINALDLAGNADSESEDGYIVTGTPPEAFTPFLNVPGPYTNNNAPILFFSTTDSDGIDHYEVKIDAGSFTIHVSPYQLPTLLDGFHTILVRAFDTLGNFRDGSVSITVDTGLPAAFTPLLDVTSPTQNTRPTVSFSTTDTNGINHYEVKVDAGGFSTRTSPYQIPVQADGAHTITVRAFDNAGNFRDGSVGVTIDTTAPAAFTILLNVTSPTNDQTPTATFSTTDANGINHYEVKIDAGSFVTQTSPYTTSTLAEGAHSITVRAFDNAGNTRDSSIGITVDLTNPIILYSDPTKVKNSAITDTTVTITDDVGLSAADISSTGGTISCAQTSATQLNCTTSIPTSGTFHIDAEDLAGNTAAQDITGYIIETSAPVVVITAPTKSSATAITDTTINITDNYQINVSSVNATGGTINCIQTSSTVVDCTSTISASGNFTVNATDIAGNIGTATESGYTIGTSAPQAFTPTLNTDSFTNNQTPTIYFSTTAESGINHYEVRIDNGTFTTQSSPYTLPELTPGFHTITVRAFDNNGNFTDGATNVTIDVESPTELNLVINVESPTNDTTPIVTFSASDNYGISKYEVKVASAGGVFEVHSSPYQVPELDEEEHTITVRAYDRAGNVIEKAADLVVDVTAPTGSFKINNGDISTKTQDVTLNLDLIDNLSGLKDITISENQDFEGAIAQLYDSTKTFKLSEEPGEKTIYIKATDKAGNTSQIFSSKIIFDPTGEIIKNITLNSDLSSFVSSGLLIILGAIALANILANPTLIYGIFFILFKKKKRTWGIVYDKDTKKPIPFVTVRLYSTDGEFISQRITGFDGKYGFLANRGKYRLEAKVSDYLTYNENFEFKDSEGWVEKDIALSKNPYESKALRNFIKNNIIRINKILVYVGFTFSIIAFLTTQNILNLIILTLYLIQFVAVLYINRKNKSSWGYVYNKNNGSRIQGAFIRVYDVQQSRQIDVAITDELGRYSFRLDDGEYLLTVNYNEYKLDESKYSKDIFRSSTGVTFIKVKVSRNPQNLVLPMVLT